MIKTYERKATKNMLSHLELLMIKGISYNWSSVRSFHVHIAKQVELYRLEWSSIAEIRELATTFFKHSTPTPLSRGKKEGGQDSRGCRQWNYTGSCACEKDKVSFSAQVLRVHTGSSHVALP